MAKDVITRFKLETTGFDSKIKQAAKNLSDYSKTATQAKEGFNQFTKANVDAAKALGTMATSTSNVKDRAKELVGAFNDAAKAYNSLTKEQQQSDWAKALAGSLTRLQQRIKETKAEMQGLGDGMKGVSGGGFLSGLSSKMEGALAVFGGNLMTKAAGAIANLGAEMGDMVKQGVELAKQGEGIRIAFERLGNGQILDGLREATHGTVTDLELMKAAVKFNDFKLPLDELGTMLAFAQQKAKDTGQSVDYMVDSIVTGLGRKSLMILDNLGLSAAEIKDKMAETGDMTKAVGAIIREQMSKAGDYVETAADRAQQANVSLQNKMEELGRKFTPVEEASNQLWTSMKIGILDIIGGPLARLLNGLTEAGRLKNMLNDLNGGGNGKESQTEKALRLLREYSGGGRGIEGKRDLYNRQMASYSSQEEKAWREANRLRAQLDRTNNRKGKDPAGYDQAEVDNLTRQMEAAENRAKAIQIMRSEYQKGAKDILNGRSSSSKGGKTTETHTATPQGRAASKVSEAERTYTETLLKNSMRLEAGLDSTLDNKKKELSAQERLFDAYNDAYATYKDPKYKEASAEAAEKIKQLAAEVKTATDTQEAAKKSAHELESAQKKLADAQREMSEAMQSNDLKGQFTAEKKITAAQTDIDRLTPKTFAVTADTGDIMERLRDIQGVTIDDKTMTVTAETTEAATALQQMEGITLTPKTFAVTADTGDIMERLRDIQGVTIDDKTMTVTAETTEAATALQQMEGITLTPKTFAVTADIVQAEKGLKKLEGLTGDKEITLTATYTPGNLDALIGNLKERISQSDVGTDLYNALTKQLADAQMLGSFIEMAYKNGIDASTLDPQLIFSKIFGDGRTVGDYIPDEFWEGLGDLMGEHLGKGIKVDANIGSVKEGEEKGDKSSENTQKVISGLNSVAGGLQQMGIKLPKGVSDVLNVVNGLMSVINGVGISINIFSNTLQPLNTAAVTANTATTAASTATLTASITALIAALETNSATNFLPFANGGIVHAADGYFVPGNNYSGDMVPALLNSGELVLNRAQQNNLASQLQGSGLQNLRLSTEIDAESIKIILNNNGERTGDGEYIKATLG